MIDSTLLLLVMLAIAADVAIVWYRRRRRVSPPATVAPHTPRRPFRMPRFTLDATLFTLTALVFLATRLIALDRWPIYFFTDEAINPVRAAEFLSNGFRDAAGTFLPTYFQNAQFLSVSTSVYAQVIPTALFGFSVYVTRAVVVLIALSGTLAVGLILRDIFKLRFWWIGALLLSITPAWFLHSRTAFENPLWVTFYAWGLYFYLRYRVDQPRHLLTALVFGGLAFYSYNGGQPGVVLTAGLLLVSDVRYHVATLRRRPGLLIAAMATLIAVALPYARFYAAHTDEITHHLGMLESYWTQSLSPGEKIGRMAQEYWNGLRPDYWFTPDSGRDIVRHQMKGYAQLPALALPVFVAGLLIALKHWRSSAHRAVLIALLIAPIGGALVATNIVRDLVMVVPATLLSSIGLIAALEWLSQRHRYRRWAPGSFALLSAVNGFMLYDAVTHGATWYTAYDLYGLQYGAQQVFEEARQYVTEHPSSEVWIAPTWLNGPDTLQKFFAPDEPRVRLFDFNAFMRGRYDIDQLIIVLARPDYQHALDSGKFTIRSIEATLPYPDGTPGFYFVQLAYSPQADALFAAESEARSRLLSDTLEWQGQSVIVAHSRLDIGPIDRLFDGDPATLIRTQDVNPAVFDLTFATPVSMSGIAITTGSMDIELAVEIRSGDGGSPRRYARTYTDLQPDPTVELDFGESLAVKSLHLEIRNPNAAAYNNVHLREVQFK